MPKFKYTAITPQGEDDGTISADSLQSAIVLLKEKNYKVVSIHEASPLSLDFLGDDFKPFQKKVTSKDLAVFCKQLHTMLTSGMPITRCMDVLAIQSENPRLKVACKQVSQDIRKGNLFSEALQAQPKIFPVLLVNMIQAGELTGNLDSVVGSMAKHYESEHNINAKIKTALIYPKFLVGISVTILTAMLIFVVPKFLQMFIDSNTELPAITVGLINLSNFVGKYFVYIVIAIIILVFLIKQLLKKPEIKYKWQAFILTIPKLGPVLKKIMATRFSRTMATLLQSGIPIVTSLDASARVTGNVVLMRSMENVIDEIRKGNSLSYYLNEMQLFPPILISMVSIGEESGNLDEMFEKAADYFDSELDENIKKLLGIIEPAMIFIMAIIMGVGIIAMYLPILKMSETIK